MTGATGFLGTICGGRGRRPGGTPCGRLVHRPADPAKLGWGDDVEQVKVDLRSKAGLAEAVRGCDAVLHLAATKAGDLYAQFGGTVVATENLLWAMQQADVQHVVAISSFAVYDYLHRRSWSVLDEESPLDEAMVDRDEYAQTKLISGKAGPRHGDQERVGVDGAAAGHDLRPGEPVQRPRRHGRRRADVGADGGVGPDPADVRRALRRGYRVGGRAGRRRTGR